MKEAPSASATHLETIRRRTGKRSHFPDITCTTQLAAALQKGRARQGLNVFLCHAAKAVAGERRLPFALIGARSEGAVVGIALFSVDRKKTAGIAFHENHTIRHCRSLRAIWPALINQQFAQSLAGLTIQGLQETISHEVKDTPCNRGRTTGCLAFTFPFSLPGSCVHRVE